MLTKQQVITAERSHANYAGLCSDKRPDSRFCKSNYLTKTTPGYSARENYHKILKFKPSVSTNEFFTKIS